MTTPRSVTIPYFDGLDYGIGVDTPSGAALNVAVTGDPTEIIHTGGQSYDYSMTSITSEDDLQTALGISAQASGAVGLFKASAEFSFAQKCKLNSSYAYAAVRIQITNAFSQIRQPGISPAAADLLSNGDMASFQRQFGDMFVRGLSRGGIFVGIIQVVTSSDTDQQNISAKLSAAYGPFSLSGQFSDDFVSLMSNRNVSVMIHAVGGVAPPQVAPSIDAMIAAANTWTPTVANSPSAFTALLDDYGVLNTPNPPNFIDLEHQRDVLTQCSIWRNLDLTAGNDITFIKDNPSQFINPDANQLDQLQNKIDQDLNTIASTASQALANPQQAQLPTLLLPPPIQLPRRISGPEVAAVSPATGSTAGGDTVTITGTGFTGVTMVNFGAALVKNLTVVSDTMLTVISPAQAAGGAVHVTVTSPAGTSATSVADEFGYVVEMPIVTAISPTSGRTLGGETVTVSGTGFTGTTKVTLGSIPATNLTVVNDTTITVVTPPQTSGGAVDVMVTTPAGSSQTSPADKYTYVVVTPVVTGVNPSTGRTAGGDTLTITGTAFTDATRVAIGSIPATNLNVLDDNTLTVTTPPRATDGPVDVTVTTPGGTSQSSTADTFTYVAPLQVTTTSLPEAICESAYTAHLQASGGLGPITWKLASGSLPVGLSLDPDGQIVGSASIDQQQPKPTFTLTGNMGDNNRQGILSPPNPPPSFTVAASDNTGTPPANSVQLTIHLVNQAISFFTDNGNLINQDASTKGTPRDITTHYMIPAPPGWQFSGTAHFSTFPDTGRPTGPWSLTNEVTNPGVIQFDVFTSGQTIFHHSGHVEIGFSCTYTST